LSMILVRMAVEDYKGYSPVKWDILDQQGWPSGQPCFFVGNPFENQFIKCTGSI
jgi:hypothetical protein